jgi:rubrerythrin
MTDKQKALAQGLLDAYKAEQYGHNFYLMAANSTQDPKGKEVFETLAAEESDHARFLKAQYDSVLLTGKASATATLGKRLDLTGMWPIFSDGLKTRIKDANFEMTALSIGIQLEKDAMVFYRSQAEQAGDPEIKKMFLFLSDWEAGHYEALLRQHEALKEDYWSTSGFAPF